MEHSTAPRIITSAHQRSVAYGLRRDGPADISPARCADVAALIEQNRLLHTHALPVMATLYRQIAGTHNMVLLTDAAGVIVHSLGDDDFLARASRVALRPGVAWSEQSQGTNAIGTAIAEKAPTLVHADQHYLAANHFLTCSAAPVTDHQGAVVGVLDVSGDQRSFHQHTMALVRMAARTIENQLFTATFGDMLTLHFHARPEFIGTLMEGIAAFGPDGRFLAANQNGLFQLGLPPAQLQRHSIDALFGLTLAALHQRHRSAAAGPLELCLHSGVRVYGQARLRLAHEVLMPAPPALATAEHGAGVAPAPVGTATAPGVRRLSGLRYLRTGDPQLAALIDKVSKVLGHAIPIMIIGETGTGKDLLAQAIHYDSPRAAGPFVAVNCAAIPETLIESELFGYEDGAFTGARKKGAPGRLLQAHGGTLFLDEIGDMPLALQARLLRVLQERTVTPLGSARSIPVDIEVICATNHKLRERIARGLFREDLYYRLNGLVVRLPPLRERTDLDAVVRKILASGAGRGSGRHTLAPALQALFRRHPWPGNIRQLDTLLRTAMVMAGDDSEIGLAHMPDDFLDDQDAADAATLPTDRHAAAGTPAGAGGALQQVEQSAILHTLAAHGGNISATARALGVSRNTIYRKAPHLKPGAPLPTEKEKL